jgi:hypothetical protein
MVMIDWQDFETVLCVGLWHCLVTMSLMLMIHIRAIPSLPFMALIRALVTHPVFSPGRVAVHDWWLSVMTHASSHWHPVLKVGSLSP